MTKILTGKEVASALTEELKIDVEKLKEKNINPKLTIRRVGNNPSDFSYERGALKRMKKCGI